MEATTREARYAEAIDRAECVHEPIEGLVGCPTCEARAVLPLVAAEVEAAVSVLRAERDEARGSLHHAEVRCNALREAGNDWRARAEAAESDLRALREKVDKVADWEPTLLVLRQLAQTIGQTPASMLPKAVVVKTLNDVADRLFVGEVRP